MLKEKILFEIIITNQCNKRCEYCKLDFKNSFIEAEVVDKFIFLIKRDYKKYTNIIVNFFGGEPLLGKHIIKSIIDSLSFIKNIKFIIGTNGLLIDKEFLDFSRANRIFYSLSIDTDSGENILDKDILKKHIDFIEVNFVLNPNSLDSVYDLYQRIVNFGYKKINIMPVFSTIRWNKEKLIELNKFIRYVDIISSNLSINKYKYFNGVSLDKQFILEINGNIYQDLDSLLWIQKQNKNLSQELTKKIEKEIFLGNIGKIDKEDLLNKHSIETILKLVFEIPKEQGLLSEYKLIEKILG